MVIYKEGDDLINSTSEYLAKVLSHLPTVANDRSSSSLSSSSSSLHLPKLSSSTRLPHSSSLRKNIISSSSSSSLHSSSAVNDGALHRRVYEHNVTSGMNHSFSLFDG